jgi:hypothetical protein
MARFATVPGQSTTALAPRYYRVPREKQPPRSTWRGGEQPAASRPASQTVSDFSARSLWASRQAKRGCQGDFPLTSVESGASRRRSKGTTCHRTGMWASRGDDPMTETNCLLGAPVTWQRADWKVTSDQPINHTTFDDTTAPPSSEVPGGSGAVALKPARDWQFVRVRQPGRRPGK